MMGVSWLDVVVSLLKFEGFTTDTFWQKVWRVVSYPLILIIAIATAIWFVTMLIIIAFKSR